MTPKNEFRVEGEVVWIKLTQGKETCVDLADWPKVGQYRWSLSGGGYYAESRVRGRLTYLHKFLCGPAKRVDHEDLDGLNNRKRNLRAATHADNQRNRNKQKNNTSGYKGVFWSKAAKKWEASLGYLGKKVYIGLFPSSQEAAEAYSAHAARLYGKFARLNTI